MSEVGQDILVASGLRKNYTLGSQEVEVLRGIDVRVRRGEALVIVGASGAGKSTLLHLLGGLDAPSAGDVSLDGASLFGMSSAARSRLRNERLGFVFQSYNLLPELDALENVCLPARVARISAGQAGRRGRELLTRVGLKDRTDHHQKNRVNCVSGVSAWPISCEHQSHWSWLRGHAVRTSISTGNQERQAHEFHKTNRRLNNGFDQRVGRGRVANFAQTSKLLGRATRPRSERQSLNQSRKHAYGHQKT